MLKGAIYRLAANLGIAAIALGIFAGAYEFSAMQAGEPSALRAAALEIKSDPSGFFRRALARAARPVEEGGRPAGGPDSGPAAGNEEGENDVTGYPAAAPPANAQRAPGPAASPGRAVSPAPPAPAPPAASSVTDRWPDGSFQIIKPGGDPITWEQAVQLHLEILNEERARHGRPPVELHPVLMELADLKARDLAEHLYLEHYSPRLGDPNDMVRKRISPDPIAVLENIAKEHVPLTPLGDRPSSPEAKERLAREYPDVLRAVIRGVHEIWMNSPPHKEGMLNAHITHVGFGYAFNREEDHKDKSCSDRCFAVLLMATIPREDMGPLRASLTRDPIYSPGRAELFLRVDVDYQGEPPIISYYYVPFDYTGLIPLEVQGTALPGQEFKIVLDGAGHHAISIWHYRSHSRDLLTVTIDYLSVALSIGRNLPGGGELENLWHQWKE